MAERAAKNPYKQFSPEQRLSFTLHTLNPDGSICLSDRQVEISTVKSGGFFGRVLIPKDEDFVIKTSVPDPWHDLWRRVNWGFRDFPSQVDETQATLDYLTSNLIADVLPVVTNSKFYAPHSLGYTQLPNGYAQVIERLYGRPPRYDNNENEFEQFRHAQRELTKLGLEIGLEQVGQVYRRDHLSNPFGMANSWKDAGNGRWIWLDTLSAIPHKGWIWPFFYFRFHKEIRRWFYPSESGHQGITFNRIHTDHVLKIIKRERHKFTDQAYQQVLDNLNLYQQLSTEQSGERHQNRNYGAAIVAALEIIRDQIPKPFQFIKNAIVTPFRLIWNPNIAALAGVEQALKSGIISQEELDDAKSNLSPDISAARTMAMLYEGYGWILSKPAEIISYAAILGLDIERVKESNVLDLISYAANQLQDPDKVFAIGAAFVGFKAYAGLVRRTGTRLIGEYYGVDTTKARFLSLIPYIGDFSAIAAQIAATSSNSGKEIWHYTVRNIVAGLSSLPIFPDGGWGSEREGRWWLKWGRHLESLGRKTD